MSNGYSNNVIMINTHGNTYTQYISDSRLFVNSSIRNWGKEMGPQKEQIFLEFWVLSQNTFLAYDFNIDQNAIIFILAAKVTQKQCSLQTGSKSR
jgi:hypothetical protein